MLNISQKLRVKWNFELTVFELTVPDLYCDCNAICGSCNWTCSRNSWVNLWCDLIITNRECPGQGSMDPETLFKITKFYHSCFFFILVSCNQNYFNNLHWHLSPAVPLTQTHVKPRYLSTQVAPLVHGLLAHSFPPKTILVKAMKLLLT